METSGPDSSPRAQAHIHPVEKTFGGDLGQRHRSAARPGAGKRLALQWPLQEEQIDIRAVVQLLPAQLAHRQDHQSPRQAPGTAPRRSSGRSAPGSRPGWKAGGSRRADRTGPAGRRPRCAAAPSAENGAGHPAVSGMLELAGRGLGLGIELFTLFGLGKASVFHQAFEIFRVAQQDLGQELAARKERHQDLDRARVAR